MTEAYKHRTEDLSSRSVAVKMCLVSQDLQTESLWKARIISMQYVNFQICKMTVKAEVSVSGGYLKAESTIRPIFPVFIRALRLSSLKLLTVVAEAGCMLKI